MAAADSLRSVELISPVEFAKRKVLSLQEYVLLSVGAVTNLFRRPIFLTDMIQQADVIGVGSIPIFLTSVFFTGAAPPMNSATVLRRFGAASPIRQLDLNG